MRMVLGQVTIDSGRVAVVDAGLLGQWEGQAHVGQAAAAARNGMALFDFGGANAAIVGDVPSGTLQVAGTKTTDGKSWRFIDLVTPNDQVVARAEAVGDVDLGQASLLIGDLNALGQWKHDEHHPAVMAQVKASPYELGHATVNGRTTFVAMTSWGGGVFPVLALRDAGGNLVAVRINLSREDSPEITAVGQRVSAAGNLPPDPMTATKTAMAGAATGMAQNAARRAVVRKIKEYVPKPLWPLIPGEGGDWVANVKKLAVEKTWAVVSGCIISALFFGVFAFAFVAFLLLIVYVIVTA